MTELAMSLTDAILTEILMDLDTGLRSDPLLRERFGTLLKLFANDPRPPNEESD